MSIPILPPKRESCSTSLALYRWPQNSTEWNWTLWLHTTLRCMSGRQSHGLRIFSIALFSIGLYLFLSLQSFLFPTLTLQADLHHIVAWLRKVFLILIFLPLRTDTIFSSFQTSGGLGLQLNLILINVDGQGFHGYRCWKRPNTRPVLCRDSQEWISVCVSVPWILNSAILPFYYVMCVRR